MNLFEMIQAFLKRAFAPRAAARAGSRAALQSAVAAEDKVAPNRQYAGIYSTAEIVSGKAREMTRAIHVQADNRTADARYKDLESKMGMRPGLDGVRVTFKTGPQ